MENGEPIPPGADAARLRAVRVAEGDPPDWEAALDHALAAAELGSALARAELAALAGEWGLAQAILAGETITARDWRALRGAVALEGWLAVPAVKLVSESPRMALAPGIATPEMCGWLIARARGRLKPAMMFDAREQRNYPGERRTNSACPFPEAERDLVMAVLRARIAAACGLAVCGMESPHVLHYAVGQEFKPHLDAFETALTPGFRDRVVTFLVSLNDGYEGGETVFPEIGGRWKGRQGVGFFFWNVLADGALDRRVLHAGRPVTAGEKWLLSQWIGAPALAATA
ncbi:MAG TPA: 2OG-Fe(II) oxygenase [Acetobacteraceae bacterium]|nr:2OG-Fe(II) oxygenase [Acetobacteraceae bacterium]